MADLVLDPGYDDDLLTALAEDARVGHAAVRGAVVGFLAISLLVALAGSRCGLGSTAAIGLGVFVGMWGGLGFGFMFGASCAGMRVMDSHDAPVDHH
jgi:hypothetical protein